MKIYTKTGDNGTTGLFAGSRVPKDDPRIQAYGAVDELNAVLGVAHTIVAKSHPNESTLSVADWIREIQADLFAIGAELATPNPEKHGMCLLKAARTEQLEVWIDQSEDQLAPLTHFILPGGTHASATLHQARTVCRRSEREVVKFSHNLEVGQIDHLIIYLNRLSDLLFVLARLENSLAGIPDIAWSQPK